MLTLLLCVRDVAQFSIVHKIDRLLCLFFFFFYATTPFSITPPPKVFCFCTQTLDPSLSRFAVKTEDVLLEHGHTNAICVGLETNTTIYSTMPSFPYCACNTTISVLTSSASYNLGGVGAHRAKHSPLGCALGCTPQAHANALLCGAQLHGAALRKLHHLRKTLREKG